MVFFSPLGIFFFFRQLQMTFIYLRKKITTSSWNVFNAEKLTPKHSTDAKTVYTLPLLLYIECEWALNSFFFSLLFSSVLLLPLFYFEMLVFYLSPYRVKSILTYTNNIKLLHSNITEPVTYSIEYCIVDAQMWTRIFVFRGKQHETIDLEQQATNGLALIFLAVV